MRFTCLLMVMLSALLLGCERFIRQTEFQPVTDTLQIDSIPIIVDPSDQPLDTVSVETDKQPEEPLPLVVALKNYEIARLSIGMPGTDSINKWLAFVGLPPKNPFCSAANSQWHEYVGLWHPRSGLARHWKTMAPGGMWINAERVLNGEVTIPAGSIVLFEKVNTIFGHVGIVTRTFTGVGSLYISANTSPPGGAGSEFSGGGVYEKVFNIIPGSSFRITGFIIFEWV